MPIRRFVRPAGLTVACAVAAIAHIPAVALAHLTEGANLRVVGPEGQTLAQLVQYSGTVRVRTDPNALCFGQGTGGSGARVKIVSPDASAVPHTPATALGTVRDASATDRDLRPLSVTDAFDFGLGVCGIGGFQAQGSASWYLKHNHAGAQVGGDQLAVQRRDEVLWYLAPSFPFPAELALKAPRRAEPGSQIEVEVARYADDGTRSPATGATVTGGDAPVTTDAQGTATVAASNSGNLTLQAMRGTDIPSNEVEVCVSDAARECAPQRLIVGTGKTDLIRGTKRADKMKAKARNDIVRAQGGGPDRVNCGGGKRDIATVDRNDTTRACEKVKKKGRR